MFFILIKKTKQKVKKKFEESLINGEKHENKDIEEKSDKMEKCDETLAIIGEYEWWNMKYGTKKTNIIWIAYQQVKISQSFKEKEKFITLVKELTVSKSTIAFEIRTAKLIDSYPKIRNLSLSLNL